MRRLLGATLALCLLAACDGAEPAGQDDRLQIAAAFYPLVFLTESIGGDLVEVTNLTPPGAEPHDLELTPDQVQTLVEADLVVYLGSGFQPSLDEAIKDGDAGSLDIRAAAEDIFAIPSAEEDEVGADPHVWLDPRSMVTLSTLVAERLAELDPDHASDFRERASDLGSELTKLDGEFRKGLADCERDLVVTAHEAFGYLAAAYDLEQVGIAGIDPESEPSPKRLAEIATFARENGVTTIFFEELLPPDLAEALASELGVETAELNPLEGPPETGDYLSGMRSNLQALEAGLGCP